MYDPYEALADNNDILHLKLNENKERSTFMFNRVFPILILMCTWFVLQQVASVIPMGWVYTMIIAGGSISIMLLLRAYNTEIKIVSLKQVFIVRKTLLGVREKRINMADIDNIILEKKRSRAGFIVLLKSGKIISLLFMPCTDERQLNLMRERMAALINK